MIGGGADVTLPPFLGLFPDLFGGIEAVDDPLPREHARLAGKGYVGKPRPVVIIQDDRFDATDSVTVCAVTTDPTEAPLLRVPLGADAMAGLRPPSRSWWTRSPLCLGRRWDNRSGVSPTRTWSP
ncbi:MAG: type II toxin-antitoxin system PemK/MazF family toxin [Pseudonocardiaceae bacterium]